MNLLLCIINYYSLLLLMSINKQVGLKRDTIDKFYTNAEVVLECYKNIKNHLGVKKGDLIIEPSAGNGAFIEIIKSLTDNYRFYDIEPENNEIIKQDYLDSDLELNLNPELNLEFNETMRIHVIGNPPFGRQSSLAIKFIKKSCGFCDTISFILPKSFKKDSLKKHFRSSFHLIFECDLQENSFLVNGKEYNVPCIFQIWEKKEYDRETLEKLEPKNFQFVKKTDNPDISFRRVGVYAGKIDTEIESKSEQSHYFIKFDKEINFNTSDASDASDNTSLSEILDKLKPIEFKTDNTVGPRSISKREVIKEFNEII